MAEVVGEEYDGMLLRDYLRVKEGLSRSMLTRLKKRDDGIVLNGRRATVRAVLHTGDELSLALDDTHEDVNSHIEPVDIPVRTVLEDEDFCVFDKPPFMPTHPTFGHYRDTLANSAAYKYGKDGKPFVFRPVNRLDRDTSGCVLVAKNKHAAYVLSKSLSDGRIKKTYVAILCGVPENKFGIIDKNIKRKDTGIIERTVCGDDEGQIALTEYEVIAEATVHGEKFSLVRATPRTGRTHQLRVHFATIGCPILGDTLYGDPGGSGYINRQALHCESLIFPHPTHGIETCVEAKLHEDMLCLNDYFYGDNTGER